MIEIRIARIEDADELTRIINLAFAIEKFFIDGDRITADQVRHYFDAGTFLAAEDGGAMLGCVYIERRGDRAYLGLLSVDPSRQGSGLGRRLVETGEAHSRGWGSVAMDLRIINLREELPRFYQRLGYVEVGTGAIAPEVPVRVPCHYVNMSKSL